MTFREHAAVRIYQTTANNSSVGKDVPAEVALKAISITAIQAAQILADECCGAWGHDYVVWRGENGNGRTVWIGDACMRCGAKK